MASFCANETELHGIFNPVWLILTTKTGKTDSVVNTLRTVLVPHI